MITAGEIRDHLLARLEPIFGRPKNLESLAETLAKHVHSRTTVHDLEVTADRLIETRKAKSFPSASELIDAVKAIAPPASPSAAGTGIEGEIAFDGEVPMVWILEEDPRWKQLCAVARRLETRAKNGHSPRPAASTSKYAPGIGRFFRTEHVRGVGVSEEDKRHIATLYAEAKRDAVNVPGVGHETKDAA